MAVYKPITKLATEAADIAVALGVGKALKSNVALDNGLKAVPSYLLEPVPVDKSNIETTVIADGFHKAADLK